MNFAGIHLLLNHLPPVGALVGLLLLAVGLSGRKDDLIRAALGVLALAALTSVPTFVSGEPAERAIEPSLAGAELFIEKHEEAARIALAGSAVLGLLSLAGLLLYRSRPISRRPAHTVFALALLTAGLLAWTAHLGGLTRHTEIRPF